MRKIRLIDADKLWDSIRNDVVPFNVAMISRHIHGSPTIDPETLPIVQELKQQLAEVTNERDAAVDALENVAMFDDSLCRYCALSDKCGLDQNESCMRFEWKGVNNHE